MSAFWSIKACYDWYRAESGTANLPDVAKVYAKMSSEAYESPDERQEMIGGFIYLRDNSTELFALYYLPDKKLYVIAIKGTKNSKKFFWMMLGFFWEKPSSVY